MKIKKIISSILIIATLISTFCIGSFSTSAASPFTSNNTEPSSSDFVYWNGSKTIKSSNMTSSKIAYIQEFLNWCIATGKISNDNLKKYSASRLTVDKSYGPACQKLAKAYQKQYSLEPDGKFGPDSIKKMKSVISAAKSTTIVKQENPRTTTNNTQKNTTTNQTTNNTSSSGKITTAQIKAVLDKYNYVSGRYWTTCEDTGTKTAHDGSQVKWDNKDCPSSTSPKKNSTGKHYVSYNYNNTWECCGFASYVMYKVTGKSISAGSTSAKAQNGWKVYTSTKSAGNLKVGDIIRYNGHSAIVYSVDKNGNATFVECWGSNGCVIKVNSGFNTSQGTRTLNYFNNSNFKYIYRYEG